MCGLCARELAYIHGHGACVNNQCPLYGQNQAECCSGEVACPVVVSRGPVSSGAVREPEEASDALLRR